MNKNIPDRKIIKLNWKPKSSILAIGLFNFIKKKDRK